MSAYDLVRDSVPAAYIESSEMMTSSASSKMQEAVTILEKARRLILDAYMEEEAYMDSLGERF